MTDRHAKMQNMDVEDDKYESWVQPSSTGHLVPQRHRTPSKMDDSSDDEYAAASTDGPVLPQWHDSGSC